MPMHGMMGYALQETIRPSADLRNHYNEVSKQCRENNEAVIITVNGRGDTVFSWLRRIQENEGRHTMYKSTRDTECFGKEKQICAC